MKTFFKKLAKTICKMIILILLSMLASGIISYIKHYNFNNTLMIIGLAYMIIGLISAMGGASVVTHFKYRLAKKSRIGSSFENEFEKEFEDEKFDFRLKDSSLRFMAFMSITGFIVIMLSYSIII